MTQAAYQLVGEPAKESPSTDAGTAHVVDVAILRQCIVLGASCHASSHVTTTGVVLWPAGLEKRLC